MKAAVIGIGSNSVRMRLAEICGDQARRLMRDREGTRLFAGLDASGALAADAMANTLGAVKRMADSARENGAEELAVFATSAVRDATNGSEFARWVQEETGVPLEIFSGEEEAALSFLGATGGGHCGVVDIGGGSTEIVTGRGEQIHCAFSCQMGAVRLNRMIPIRSHEDLPLVEAAADAILLEKLREHPALTIPGTWIGTGGTFTSLAALVRNVRWSACSHHGTVLTLEAVENQAWRLADMPLEERLKLPGLQPHRADIVVHGICILLAVMRRLGLASIRVSEYGNTEGYLKRRYHLQSDIAP
ncbi:MAG: hypothetical protein IKK21_04265 [Clostridia bacterium]|nr:hypothetical protein [Clostridia bacterium]